jgi:hypothetical protein
MGVPAPPLLAAQTPAAAVRPWDGACACESACETAGDMNHDTFLRPTDRRAPHVRLVGIQQSLLLSLSRPTLPPSFVI